MRSCPSAGAGAAAMGRDRIRILVVAYRFPPQGGGGVQRIAKLVKHWSREGAEIAVLAGPAGGFKLEDATLWGEIPDQVPVRHVADPGLSHRLRRSPAGRRPFGRVPSRPLTAAQWLLFRLCLPDLSGAWFWPASREGRRLCRSFRPQIIFVSGPPWTPLLVARGLSRGCGAKLAVDYRDPWTVRYLPVAARGLSRLLGPALERWVLREAGAVTFAHRAIIPGLRHWISPAARRLWAPNGYDPEDFSGGPGPAEAGNRFTLTYTGGFFSWRSPRVLFAVLEEMLRDGRLDPERFRLVLAGSVAGARRHIAPGGRLAAATRELGYLPHEESVRLLTRSTVNLLLEGELGGINRHTPGKFYELLYAGRPVLVLCPEGVTTQLARRAGGCWIAPPADPALIGRRLEELFSRWSRDEELSGPDRSRLRFYDRSHQAQRILRLLMDLAE
ncbi:MAG: hypothetical protein GF355_00355 [Candidatus Eisenbacteria bacterium]|nr:hypothetical protein [Candidatus Eisenbacteria bacterium]